MGRPAAKKTDQNQPRKCQSCTTRLRAPSAIYHTGSVGRYCHVAAEIKEKAELEKAQEQQEESVDLTDTGRRTRNRKSSVSPEGSPGGSKENPVALRKEIDQLKALVANMFKSKAKPNSKKAKRKRTPSPGVGTSGDEHDSSSEDESTPESSPEPSRKRHKPGDPRNSRTKSKTDKTRQKREHAPARRST